MKIRKLWIVVPFAAAMAFTVQGAATASAAEMVKGPKVTWKYNVWGKRRAFTEGVEYVAKYVSDKTGGNFKIKVFYGEQLGGKKQNLDNLKAGVLDAAQFCSSYHPGKNESLTVLNLPFLPISNPAVQQRVHEAVYSHDIVRQEMASKWNVTLFMSSLLPQYEFLGKGKLPKTLADWKGQSVRALGGLGDAMEKLGARKNTVTATEVYQAIDRGAVNAVSFPYTYAHVAFKIDEVAEWFTTNMAPGTVDCPTAVSLKSWNALPAAYRKLLMDAKPGAYKALIAAYKKADDKNLPKFHKKLKAITYSAEQLAEFRKVGGQPVYDDWIKKHSKDFDAAGLLDYVMKTASK